MSKHEGIRVIFVLEDPSQTCTYFKALGNTIKFLMGPHPFVERGPSTIKSALVIQRDIIPLKTKIDDATSRSD